MSNYLFDGQWSLGMLIDAIEKRPTHKRTKDEPPSEDEVCFDFGYFIPCGIGSYRGFYNNLALRYASLSSYPQPPVVRVGQFLATLRAADGQVFEGYKGGSYVMSRQTPLWVANADEATSVAVVGICDDELHCRIKTAWVNS